MRKILLGIITFNSCNRQQKNKVEIESESNNDISNLKTNSQDLDFKATLKNTSFRLVEKDIIKDFRKMVSNKTDGSSLDYRYNQWYFDIDIDLKNLSNELIEDSELVIYLSPRFNNGKYFTVGPMSQEIQVKRWRNNETITVSKSFRLELNEHFKKGIMEHTPENLYLSVFILADNSIGYSNQVRVVNEKIIPTW